MAKFASASSYDYHEVMKAAEMLLLYSSSFSLAEADYDLAGGSAQLTFFSPDESRATAIGALSRVIPAIRPFLSFCHEWTWNLYTADGLVVCHSDGRALDQYGKPLASDPVVVDANSNARL